MLVDYTSWSLGIHGVNLVVLGIWEVAVVLLSAGNFLSSNFQSLLSGTSIGSSNRVFVVVYVHVNVLIVAYDRPCVVGFFSWLYVISFVLRSHWR